MSLVDVAGVWVPPAVLSLDDLRAESAPPPELPVTEEATKKALDIIQEQCVLFIVSSHGWTGQYTAEDAETLVGGDRVAQELLTEPRWNLIPAKWRTRLSSFGRTAQRIVRSYAIPFIVKGQYFVALSQSDQCLDEVQVVKDRQATAVAEFIEQYPDMVDNLRTKLGDKFGLVAKHLPDAGRLGSRFSLDVVPLKVSLVEFLDARSGAGVLKEAKKAAYAKVMEVVNNMIEGPRQQLAAAVTNLRDLVVAERRYDERSLDAVRKQLERLKGFAFVADSSILEAMRGLDSQLQTISAQQVKQGGQVAKDLVEALGAVETAAATDALEGRAIKKFRRQILLS